jgi:hypothetical protein
MMQVVGRVFGLFTLAIVIGIGAITSTSGSSGPDPTTITDLKADYTVSAGGELRAVETFTAEFSEARHGIFRLFDTRFQGHPKDRLIVKDVQVTRDGKAEHFSMETQKRGRFQSVKIGDANSVLFGEHVYRISYRIAGVLTRGTSTPTQFYWNLIGSGWTMSINAAEITVHLPAVAQSLLCAQGAGASAGTCTASGEGSDTVEVHAGPLAPNTPVTIKAGLDVPTPKADTLPWPSTLDPILGRHPVLLLIVLALAALLGLLGAMLSFSTREKTPAYPLMYAPPEGIGPAQAAYLLTEKIDDKAFVATMMYAAEQKAVTLAQDGDTWTIAGTADADAWKKVDEVTQEAGQRLGVVNGSTFAASPGSVAAGQQLKGALSSFHSDTRGWARVGGFMEPSGLGGGGFVVLILSAGLSVWLGAFNPLHMSILALVPGLFGIAALGVGASGAGTRRTASGRELWSRIGGFRRILSTPSAQDRFDFSGRKDLYTAYLPWAVAFDCADEWAKKYRIETGEEPPAPSYFAGYAGVHTGLFVSQMVSSFDSAVSSAISSYEATQSHSSGGGGGGFSGGGGGGGGGGGSW